MPGIGTSYCKCARNVKVIDVRVTRCCWCGHSNWLLCARQCTNQNSLACRQWCSLCLLWNSLTFWISSPVGEHHFTPTLLALALSRSCTISPVWWCHRGFSEDLLWHHWEHGQVKPISCTMCSPCSAARTVCPRVAFKSLLRKVTPRVSVTVGWLISPLMPISATVERHLFECVMMTLQQSFRAMGRNENTAHFNR